MAEGPRSYDPEGLQVQAAMADSCHPTRCNTLDPASARLEKQQLLSLKKPNLKLCSRYLSSPFGMIKSPTFSDDKTNLQTPKPLYAAIAHGDEICKTFHAEHHPPFIRR